MGALWWVSSLVAFLLVFTVLRAESRVKAFGFHEEFKSYEEGPCFAAADLLFLWYTVGSGWFQAGKKEPYILLERLDEKVVKLPILHSVRNSPPLFKDKQFLAVSRPKDTSRGDTTSIELVLYRQHHFHKRLYGHRYFHTHFWIFRPVSC